MPYTTYCGHMSQVHTPVIDIKSGGVKDNISQAVCAVKMAIGYAAKQSEVTGYAAKQSEVTGYAAEQSEELWRARYPAKREADRA
ncbi:MAG: hypothetical protein QGG20_07730, partial [Dehalococcoidia bacterium]|nr:hypothetical protein [Dehalococcoidia bacterium]